MSTVEFAPPLRFGAAHFFNAYRCGSFSAPRSDAEVGQFATGRFRQVAMYLAKHVGRWTTTAIGRFYNGRDHSTVCYCTQKIASLRKTRPEVEAVVIELKQILENPTTDLPEQQRLAAFGHLKPEFSQAELDSLAEQLIERVYCRIRDRFSALSQEQPHAHF